MSLRQAPLIEGLTAEQVLALPSEHLDRLILTGKPIVFRVGTATVLGQFEISGTNLVLELAHIDGGGEGALPTIASVADRYARQRNLAGIEWFVYATACAKPNPKLRRVLLRRGFTIVTHPSKGECFYLRTTLE